MKKGQKMGELVVKDNALINASYNLELVEQRLMLIGITTARKSGKGITAMDPLSIHASEYAKQFNVTIDGAYKALKESDSTTFQKIFEELSKQLGKLDPDIVNLKLESVRKENDEKNK